MAKTMHSITNVSAKLDNTTSETDNVCYIFFDVYLFQMVDSVIPYVVNSTLNGLLAIAATVANVLVFAAVRHTNSIRLPSKLLLLSLILTDLGVGLVVQPQFAIYLIAKLNGSSQLICFSLHSYGFAGDLLSSASLLTMTAICIDRYIAFFSHVRYQEIVTSRRIIAVLVFIWLSAVCYGASTYVNQTLFDALVFSGFTVCFLVMFVAYIKIYRGLRSQHGRQVQDQAAQGSARQETRNTLNVAKYRRSVSSMLWIYGLFIFCYSPYIFMRILTTFYQNVIVRCILEFSITLVFVNSCLNPMLYCFRLPEVRAKVLQKLRSFLPLKS